MEIVYYVASSADGFIATADGGVEWLDDFHVEGEDHGYAEFNASVDVLFMGRHTYEVSLKLGGFQYYKQPCWVFSSRDLDPEVPTVTVTDSNPEELVAELEGTYNRAWLLGGGELASSFQRAGLITEYRIFLIPTLLGDGIPLFGKAGGTGRLELTDTTSYGSGIVELRYRG